MEKSFFKFISIRFGMMPFAFIFTIFLFSCFANSKTLLVLFPTLIIPFFDKSLNNIGTKSLCYIKLFFTSENAFL